MAFDPPASQSLDPPVSRSLDAALALVGDRWALLIVEALLAGPRRFNELSGAVPGIASNILIRRLRQLEQDGVILATPYSRRPLRFRYELTADGHALAGALQMLAAWGERRGGRTPTEIVHATCGTALEVRLWCSTCARPADDHESEDGLVWL